MGVLNIIMEQCPCQANEAKNGWSSSLPQYSNPYSRRNHRKIRTSHEMRHILDFFIEVDRFP